MKIDAKFWLAFTIVFFSIAVVALILMFVFPSSWVLFAVMMGVSIGMGIYALIFFLVSNGRNKNWDADYK